MKNFTAIVDPSQVRGSVRAPSSKSMMIRALAGAWLAGGNSRILEPSLCRDAMNVSQALSDIGVVIRHQPQQWEIQGGKPMMPDTVFHVGESGLGARMFIALASKYDYSTTITGSGSLLDRPMEMILDPLTRLGVSVRTRKGYLPVVVKGPLHAGSISVDGSGGSQFITGLLMALPLADGDSVLKVDNLHSRPYIDLTLEVLSDFNIEIDRREEDVFYIRGNQQYVATAISVEGDWSGASFLLVAGAIAGDITVTGLNTGSRQADMKIMQALQKAGIEIQRSGVGIRVKQGEVKPFSFDITHCPDLAPPLVALAAFAEGTSVLSGAGRLVTKESNRADTLMSETAKLGVSVTQDGDKLLIHGGNVIGGRVHAHNDHRIAMATAVMGLGAQQRVEITQAECVEKSYPLFFNDLKNLGGKIDESIR